MIRTCLTLFTSHMGVGECLFPVLLDLPFCTILVYLGNLFFLSGKSQGILK